MHALVVAVLAATLVTVSRADEPHEPRSSRSENRDGAELVVTIDRERLSVTERLHLTVTVTAPAQRTVAFPQVDERLGGFRVLERSPIAPEKVSEDEKRWQRTYLLEPVEAGAAAIPPLTVTVKDARAPSPTACALIMNCDPATQAAALARLELASTALEVSVYALTPADADLTKPKDLAPPASLAQISAPLLPPAAAPVLLAATLVLGALTWIWRRRRKRPAGPAGERKGPHDIALDALAALDMKAGHEQFFAELSSVLRRYAASRFDLDATRQTTTELRLALDARAALLERERRDLIMALLERCDLVKFACARASRADMRAALSTAERFVRQTAEQRPTAGAAPT